MAGEWPIAMKRPFTGRLRRCLVTTSSSTTASMNWSPSTSTTTEFHTGSAFGLSRMRACIAFDARKLSRRWITYTFDANLVR